jgi:hypothetical protein
MLILLVLRTKTHSALPRHWREMSYTEHRRPGHSPLAWKVNFTTRPTLAGTQDLQPITAPRIGKQPSVRQARACYESNLLSVLKQLNTITFAQIHPFLCTNHLPQNFRKACSNSCTLVPNLPRCEVSLAS